MGWFLEAAFPSVLLGRTRGATRVGVWVLEMNTILSRQVENSFFGFLHRMPIYVADFFRREITSATIFEYVGHFAKSRWFLIKYK